MLKVYELKRVQCNTMKVNFANSNACAGNGGVLLLGYGLTFQKRRKGACLKTQANDLMHNKTEKPPRKMNMGPQMHKLCCHTVRTV